MSETPRNDRRDDWMKEPPIRVACRECSFSESHAPTCSIGNCERCADPIDGSKHHSCARNVAPSDLQTIESSKTERARYVALQTKEEDAIAAPHPIVPVARNGSGEHQRVCLHCDRQNGWGISWCTGCGYRLDDNNSKRVWVEYAEAERIPTTLCPFCLKAVPFTNGNCGLHECAGPIPPQQGKPDSLAVKTAKPRYSLLPWAALKSVVRVFEFGAKKHSTDGWKTVPDAISVYKDAAARHLEAMMLGEERDPETGELHADHLTCCALIISWHEQHK